MPKTTSWPEPAESWLKAGPRCDSVFGVHSETHIVGGKSLLFYSLFSRPSKDCQSAQALVQAFREDIYLEYFYRSKCWRSVMELFFSLTCIGTGSARFCTTNAESDGDATLAASHRWARNRRISPLWHSLFRMLVIRIWCKLYVGTKIIQTPSNALNLSQPIFQNILCQCWCWNL